MAFPSLQSGTFHTLIATHCLMLGILFIYYYYIQWELLMPKEKKNQDITGYKYQIIVTADDAVNGAFTLSNY